MQLGNDLNRQGNSMKTDASTHSLGEVLQALCRRVGTSRALTVSLLLKHGEFGQLLSLRTDPALYLDAEHYRRDNMLTEFLRKCRLDSVIDSKDRKDRTLALFYESEHLCAKTNMRFQHIINNHNLEEVDMRAIELLYDAKKWISRILGPLPQDLNGSFGPGSTYLDQGKVTTIPDKISSQFHCTPGLEPLLPFIERTAWWRHGVAMGPRGVHLEWIKGNRFTTVPKSALVDRGICIEPSANIFLQKDVGKILKQRLKRAGVDLRHAQYWHQVMARKGSLTGDLATIDLSSASDTVSLRLVEFLLPEEWFQLLNMLRSPFTLVNKKWVYLQKFSSMGNGFTFELETLIFAALAYACGAGDFGVDYSVFGDDIIVPTCMARELIALLRYCGFKENPKKTFLTGYFRESCGGDFFKGEPVRAHNVEEPPEGPEDWISLANGLYRLGLNDSKGMTVDGVLYSAWMRVLDNIPSEIRRLRGPTALGDLAIHDDDETKWRYKWQRGPDNSGPYRYFQVWKPIPSLLPWHHWNRHTMYAAALYGVPSEGVATRGELSYKVGRVIYS
jgi:hypothetical protein